MTDKPIKHVELSSAEWEQIKAKIIEEFGQKIIITWVLKRECGFTVRSHTDWNDGNHRRVICLDFYDEQMKTWFILKYL